MQFKVVAMDKCSLIAVAYRYEIAGGGEERERTR